MQNKGYLFFLMLIVWIPPSLDTVLWGQEIPKRTMTLNEALETATEESLDAFKAKRKYGAGYWTYRSFRAKLLPKVDLQLQPFTFNRSFIKRYDPLNNIDVYREQQNLNTFAQISINQNIRATGATVYMNSTFNRLENFGDPSIQNYSTTPIRIGLLQPLMAFNELKWEDRTADLEYKKAKKEYLAQQQEIHLKTVSLFFRWALASTKVGDCRGEPKER